MLFKIIGDVCFVFVVVVEDVKLILCVEINGVYWNVEINWFVIGVSVMFSRFLWGRILNF